MDRYSTKRHSLLFTSSPSQRLTSSQSRRSVSALDSSGAIETLFETLLNDPTKRDIVLKLLMQDKKELEEAQRKKAEQNNCSPLKKVKKKFTCESPTALLRRRALQQNNQNENAVAVVARTDTPSPVPFERLLDGVVAYAEIKSNNCDRSAGANALMRAMGAVVKDTFTRDVTHVIFKDGSFTTYQKAKLMKTHLVSILWLEAIRRNQVRVPEKNYPALGTEKFTADLTLLCEELQKDYEDAVHDELKRNIDVAQRNVDDSSSRSSVISDLSEEDVIDVSQDCDAVSIISKASRCLYKTQHANEAGATPSKTSTTGVSTSSDCDSEVGVINGHVVKKVSNNLLKLRNNTKAVFEAIEAGVTPLKTSSDCDSEVGVIVKKVNSNNLLELENNSKAVVENVSSESVSLLTNKKVSEKSIKSMSRSIYRKVDEEDGLVQSDRDRDRRKTIHLSASIVADEKELLSKKDVHVTAIDMDLTNCGNRYSINENFITRRKKQSTAGTSEFVSNSLEVNSSKNKSQVEAISDENVMKFSRRISARLSSKIDKSLENEMKIVKGKTVLSDNNKECSVRKRIRQSISRKPSFTIIEDKQSNDAQGKLLPISKPIRKSNSMQEISSSTDASTKSAEDMQLDKANSVNRRTRKSSTTQELSSLRLSPNSQSRKSTEAQNKRKSSSSQELLTNLRLSEYSNNTRNSEKSEENKKTKKSTSSCDLLGNTKQKTDENKENSGRNLRKRKSSESSIETNSNSSPKMTDDESPPKRQKTSKHDEASKRLAKPKEFDNNGGVNSDERNSDSSSQASNSQSDESPTEKKKVRKLYNLNQPSNELIADSAEEKRPKKNDAIIFKRPAPVTSATPLLVTPSALAYIEKLKNMQSNSSNTEKPHQKIIHKKTIKEIAATSTSNQNKPADFHRINKQIPPTPTRKSKKENEVNLTTDQKNTADSHRTNKEIPPTPTRKSKIENAITPTTSQKKTADTQRTNKEITQTPTKKSNRKTAATPTTQKKVAISKEILETPTRKSGRIIKQKTYVDEKSYSQKNRRSTLDFLPKVIKTPAKIKSEKNVNKSSVVCTRFHSPEVQVFQQIVKKLGGFFVEDEVTDKTTHLVAGEAKRTINMLRAIARGCWILRPEWLYESLEAGKWLQEEDYELTEFSPAVQQCRQQHQAFGPLFSMDIFENCGPIFIAKSSIPRCSDLQEIVKLSKGEVTLIERNAVVVVGQFVKREGVTCVVEKWILDSVMYNKKKAFKNYLIKGN